jgi:hypothetical protein
VADVAGLSDGEGDAEPVGLGETDADGLASGVSEGLGLG